MTSIPFRLVRDTELSISVYDAAGRLVEELADASFPAGEHRLEWDASGQPAGIYFCRMRTREGEVRSLQMQKLE